jgi:serine phosphatase RsbU (regulator of sigma subunit)
VERVTELALVDLVLRGRRTDPSDVESLVADAGRLLGASTAVAYLANYGESHLVPMASAQAADRRDLSVDGTVAGRAFATGQPVLAPGAASEPRTLWVPLLDADARVGVLEVVLPGDQVDQALVEYALQVANVLAEVLASRGRFGDVNEFTRRRRQLVVAAELQWSLLPPQTYVSDRVQVAASLEPSTEVAGDSYDYALNGEILHLACLDSMGHGLVSGMVSAVAISAYRNARRRLADLAECARAIEDAVSATTDSGRFVTALLAELDVGAGRLRWCSAGHPPPLLLRDGRGSELEVRPVPPLGLGLWSENLEIGERTLQPDDQVLLYTDGVVEARGGREGGMFSLDRLADFVLREADSGMSAAEVLRRLNRTILEYQGGVLQDDATTVLVRWEGQRDRAAEPRVTRSR